MPEDIWASRWKGKKRHEPVVISVNLKTCPSCGYVWQPKSTFEICPKCKQLLLDVFWYGRTE